MYLKRISLMLLSFLCLLFIACSSDDERLEEVINPIELNYTSALFDDLNSKAELIIINGNEGYKLFYPKKIYMDVHNTYHEIDFPYDKIRATLIEDTVFFECNLSEDDTMFLAYFLLTDAKNQKCLIPSFSSCMIGPGPRFDRETESKIMNDPDYWQK